MASTSPEKRIRSQSSRDSLAAAREGLFIFAVVLLIFVGSWVVAWMLGYFERFSLNFAIGFFAAEIFILAILFYFLYWRKKG